MKLDPYKNKEKYLKWKEKVKDRILELSSRNSTLLLEYLRDMEVGINIGNGTRKGSRSFNRLNTLRYKIVVLMNKLEEIYKITDVSKVSEEQLHNLFSDMRNGIIKRIDGKTYRSVGDYVKDFKSFWHWLIKVNKKRSIETQDITTDIDTSKEKPDWVYLTEEQVKKLADNARYDYRVLIWFLYDTGIRAPTELMNIRVSDLTKDCKELNIRDEISKTFGRKIKLMFCSKLLSEFIKNEKLTEDSQLFNIQYYNANKYLKRLAKNLLGESTSQSGQKYSEISLYDFRHNSACYWVSRYPTQQGMMYRFGWKEADKIHYYTEFLGMKDNISEGDLITETDKTEKDKKLEEANKQISFLNDRTEILEKELKRIAETNLLIIQRLERMKGGKLI